MEQRVRGVFARKNSARPAKVLALALCVALGVGCFTTACQPAEKSSGVPEPTPTATQSNRESVAPEQSEDTSTSFLEGLTESDDIPGPFVSRIERDAVSLDELSTIAFDADVIVPDIDSCGIARLKQHIFSDAEFISAMEYFAPGAEWMVQYESVPFSLDAVADGDPFDAVCTNDAGYEVQFSGTRNGSNMYYSRYPGVMAYSDYDETDYANIEDAGFEQQWPISSEDALPAAEEAIRSLGIENVALSGMERAVTYLPGMQGTTVDTRGWMFYFSNELNGLVRGEMHYCGYNIFNSDLPNYQVPLRSMFRVFVDKTGVGMVEWRKAYDLSDTVYQNVAVLSAEEIADRMTEYLQMQHEQSPSFEKKTTLVTEMRLCAVAISEYKSDFIGSTFDMEFDEGLLVPCWEFETWTDWGEVYSSGLTTVYVFDAVNGEIIIAKDYRKDPTT
jgi:hypothetical protein